MSKRHGYDYTLLDYKYRYYPAIPLDQPNRKFASQAAIDYAAMRMTEHWPGYPADPSQPVYNVDSKDIFPPVKPVYVSRRRRRGGGYANLYNYNTIP
uniref:Uncharacterized protein n=1 Tax=Marseillevirus LCMAC101 TaxID=2506602 RepID=A0A481YQV8_9VIRU|nr:MAG: hypothetical protein LCMAC101_02280 [Marseillevirus LCMAC101]